MTQKFRLSDSSDESKNYLAKVGIMTACVRFFFFKQKTAYEIVSRDWSSDVCSSDLPFQSARPAEQERKAASGLS